MTVREALNTALAEEYVNAWLYVVMFGFLLTFGSTGWSRTIRCSLWVRRLHNTMAHTK